VLCGKCKRFWGLIDLLPNQPVVGVLP